MILTKGQNGAIIFGKSKNIKSNEFRFEVHCLIIGTQIFSPYKGDSGL